MNPRLKLKKQFAYGLKYKLREYIKQAQPELSPQLVNDKVNAMYEDENGPCYQVTQQLAEAIEAHRQTLKLNKNEMSDFLKNKLLSLEPVLQCLQAIATDHKDELPTYIHNASITIYNCMAHTYQSRDNRQIENEERPIRRMTALARLFRLKKGLSMCNAVTIHQGELLLAFNMSFNDNHDEVMKLIQQKIAVLEAHFNKVSKMTVAKYHEEQQALSQETYAGLLAVGGNSLKDYRVLQSLDKITDTLLFDPECPIPEIKHIFQQGKLRCRVLLPLMDEDNRLQIMCDDQLLKTPISTQSVTYAHCEQILAFYLFQWQKIQQDQNNPLHFGITKLCCQPCRENLQGLPVIVSGSHGEYEHQTLCFFKQDHEMVATAASPGTPRREITHPPESPPSAQKRREEQIELDDLVEKTRKRFVFADNGLFGRRDPDVDPDDDELPDDHTKPVKKGRI